jgi:hypothetical protein
VVDDAAERAQLARRSGAVAVDLESVRLAATGRLVGVVRVVSDTPSRPLGALAAAAKPDGSVSWSAVARAFATEPRTAVRAAGDARRALARLEHVAAGLARD